MATESPVKRQHQAAIQTQQEQYQFQNELSTIGMRIRQSVDQGYRVPEPPRTTTQAGFSNVCVQDNSNFTIPEYKRVPLPSAKQPPMLVNQRTVSSSSSLEMWEDKLDERLNNIDNDIMRNKLGAGDFMLGGTKRAFGELEDW